MANESDQARTLGQAFCSYARADSAFALRLARDLKARGATIWIDELDIAPGARWDRSIEEALSASSCLLLILSPGSVTSENVMDEVAYAIETHKKLIPVLYLECNIPFRLRRFQYVDFRTDYDIALQAVLRTLGAPEHIPALANEADVESTGHSAPVPIAEIPESQQPAHAAPLRNEEMPESRQSAASEIVQDETNGVLTEPFVKTRALRAAVLRKPYVIGTAVLMLSIAGWYVFGRPAAEPASGIFAIRIPISCGTSEQKQFSEEVLRKIRALPGVVSAAITDLLPATAAETEFFQGEEQTQSCQGQARLVSPEYFSTMRMRLLQGRDFTSTDDSSKPMVVVISESMARLCFSGVNPIGRRLTNASSGFKPLVVGVVGDPQPSPPNPLFYIPQSQRTSGSARCGVDLLVRTPDMSRVNQVKLEQSIRGQLLPSAGGATIWNVGGQSRD